MARGSDYFGIFEYEFIVILVPLLINYLFSLCRYNILCTLLLFLHLSMEAQEPGMWHITDDDGLPSTTVYHTAQDHKGFIWIGTGKGICRFDGQNFKTYRSEELNDNEILKIEVDSLNRVWFRNLSGQLFYIDKDIIHNSQSLLGGSFNTTDFTVDGHTIWITFQQGSKGVYDNQLIRLSFDKKGVFAPSYLYSQKLRNFEGFRKSGDSIYVFSQDPRIKDSKSKSKSKSLIRLDKASNDIELKSTFTLPPESKRTSTSYHILEEESYLSFSTVQETVILKLVGNQPQKLLSFKEKTILNDLQIIDEQLWMLTKNGITVKNLVNNQLQESVYLLKNKNTNHLMVDHEGNKWISTSGNGIYIITAPKTQVINTNTFNLPSNEIYSLEYDYTKKMLLLGHNKGYISVINDTLKNKIITSNPSGRIVDIMIDQSGNYWFVNETELIILNADLVMKNLSTRLRGGIKTLLQTKNKDLWVGTFAASYRVPQKNVNYFILNIQPINPFIEFLLVNRTYALYQDYADHVWMGSTKGLYIYRDTLHAFLDKGKHITSSISSITQSVDSVIWVATRGDGILAIKDHQVIQRIKEADGLASNTIKKLFTTNHHLWVATDNGVNKIDLKSKETEWINKTDGLPSNDVNDIEVVNDKVWVATSKGLANFSINAQHKNKIPPPVFISNIKIEEKDTTLQDSFLLSYDNNSIQIDMIGLGYKGKGNISYQYKLSGLEKTWVYTTSQFARYPNLSPGKYTFEVFAINEDQVKSSKPASVYFSIQPPWWKTWWFSMLCFLTVGASIAYFVKAKIQRQKEEQHFLDHVQALKTKALRSQMNPHFIFNALNAIQRFLTTNDREQAMNYLSNFGKLIRFVFEQSQLEMISLEEELDFLKLYLDLEKLRFMDAISINLEVSPSLQEIHDEIHLPPLLIQPIIENSFKHGFLYKKEPGILSIKFSREDAFLICTVEDNGIGRKKATALGQKTLKDRPSSGLKTSEERLRLLKPSEDTNGTNIKNSQLNFIDLYDSNGGVRGTLVEIKIYCSDLEPIQ